MSNYENAPATKLLATHCCACGRPLLDSVSVEAGMGPDCRKRMCSEPEVIPDWAAVATLFANLPAVSLQEWETLSARCAAFDARGVANWLTHAIAAGVYNMEAPIADMIAIIERLGFRALANRLRERAFKIRIEEMDGMLHVHTPYSQSFSDHMYRGRIGRWIKEEKCYLVPMAKRRALWSALQLSYSGEMAIGPKGPFKL